MSKTDESDSDGMPDYEDDFEKDLDWLINEDAEKDSSTENQNVKEPLSDRNSASTPLVKDKNEGDRSPNSDSQIVHDDPNLTQDSELEEDEEAKRYIAEKIEEANKKLEMEIIDENRERKLKFKDSLVDLEIPPLEFPDSHRSEEDVTDGISQLYISDVLANKREYHNKSDVTVKEPKDGKVLVEKEGKFELVSIQDVESLCSLPPINNNKDLPKSSSPTMQSSQFGTVTNADSADEKSVSSNSNMNGFMPHPPAGSKLRPSSANNLMKSVHKVKPQRRVQSASVSTGSTTFSLSSEQKQQLKRFQERQEKLRIEEEERKKQEEEEKKRENEQAFKIWLQKKNEQLIQARRVKHAKELEETSTADEERDSKKAYELWLKRKHREQMTEKKMEELRQQECGSFFNDRKEREDAFARWLTMKRKQKRAEQQAAKERSRRLLLEARRRKQIDSLLYSIADSKPFCYMNHM